MKWRFRTMRIYQNNSRTTGKVLSILMVISVALGAWASAASAQPKSAEERRKAFEEARAKRAEIVRKKREERLKQRAAQEAKGKLNPTSRPSSLRNRPESHPASSTTSPAPYTRRTIPQKPGPDKIPPKPGYQPHDMRLDAENLEDISDEELLKWAEQAKASTTQPASVRRPSPPSPAQKGQPGVPKDARTGTPDLKKIEPGWWKLPAEERPYFFSWNNTPFDKVLKDLEEMSGLSMIIGGNSQDTKSIRPITFQSVKLMNFDEALTEFNRIIIEFNFWVVRRGGYLELRRDTEWYRQIMPERMYASEEAYKKANLPLWEVASVIYQPKQAPAEVLAQGAIDIVPLNAARATLVPNSNRIQLTGFVKYIEQQLEYIRNNDVKQDDGREWKIYKLNYASPGDAAQMLRSMLPGSRGVVPTAAAPQPTPTRTPRTRGTPQPSPSINIGVSTTDTVDIQEDTRLNRLLILATPAKHEMVQEYLDKYIDVESTGVGNKAEMIELKYADPEEVINIVESMLGESKLFQPPTPPATRGKPAPPPPAPRMQKVPTTAVLKAIPPRSIMVKADPDDLAEIKEYITMLDVPPDDEEDSNIRYITLKHAQASGVASMLSQTIGSRSSSSRSSTRQRFRAVADQSNPQGLIITSGNRKELDEALALIEQIDFDPNIGGERHMLKLKTAAPSSVSQILMSLYPGSSGGSYRYSSRGSASAALPRFIADDQSKTLVVVCKEEQWTDIENVINELDADSAKTPKAYKIKYASASAVYSALNNMARSGGRYDPSGPSVTYDSSSKTVIVIADEAFHEKAAKLIAEMDVEEGGAITLTYQIEHGKASSIYNVVYQSLYRDASRSNTPFYVTYDQTSNVVVATATQEYQDKVKELIAKLDVDTGGELVAKTYPLKNAKANTVYSLIYNTLYRMASTAGIPFSGTYDSTTNSVLFSTNQEYQDKAAEMITALDVKGDEKPVITKSYKIKNITA